MMTGSTVDTCATASTNTTIIGKGQMHGQTGMPGVATNTSTDGSSTIVTNATIIAVAAAAV